MLVILLSNCRKYDDCRAFSLKSGETVLSRGIWRIEKYEVNGVDSTDFILNNPNYADLEFKPDGTNSGNGTFSSGNISGGYKITDIAHFHMSCLDSSNLTNNVLYVRDSLHPIIEFYITCLKKKHLSIKSDYYARSEERRVGKECRL